MLGSTPEAPPCNISASPALASPPGLFCVPTGRVRNQLVQWPQQSDCAACDASAGRCCVDVNPQKMEGVENVHRAVVRNHSPVSSVAALDWVAFAILAALAAAAFARDAAIFAGDLDSPPTDPPSTPLSEAVFCTIAI